MKKMVLIVSIATVGLFADTFGSLAKDVAISQAKSQVKTPAMTKAVASSSAALASATQEKVSLKDTAVDMAAQKAEDTVGKETLQKETAKSLIKSAF